MFKDRSLLCKTHKLPSTVSSTQHRQAPTPQAIRFFQRDLTFNVVAHSVCRHCLHHRHRTAAVKHLPRLLQCRVLGDQSMLAHRAVVGRHIHTSNLLKLLKLEQIALAARPNRKATSKPRFSTHCQDRASAPLRHLRRQEAPSTPCRQGWKTLCRAAAQDSARGLQPKPQDGVCPRQPL